VMRISVEREGCREKRENNKPCSTNRKGGGRKIGAVGYRYLGSRGMRRRLQSFLLSHLQQAGAESTSAPAFSP